MASWNEETPDNPLGFFVGMKNACLIMSPFWVILIAIVILIKSCT